MSLGQEFQLRNGQTAAVGTDGLLVRFDRVSADGRCAAGSPCAQDGDAVVVIVIRQPPKEPASLELHTQNGLAADAASEGYRVKLVRLEPRPVGDQPVPLPQYTATLIVSRS